MFLGLVLATAGGGESRVVGIALGQAVASLTIKPMSSTPEAWTVRHFSQANPKGPGCDSVPALLRRLADSIEALGPVEVQDVVIQSEMTEFGSWRSGTVYFHLSEAS